MQGVLYTDGGARGNPGPAGFGALLYSVEGQLIDLDGSFESYATNNFAEYSALIIGIKLAVKRGINTLECKLDSELVVKQLNGEYKVKDEKIKFFYDQIMTLKKDFVSIKFMYVPRKENYLADRLVNLILDIRKG